MVLKDIAYYVEESISSDIIDLSQYVTTDSLLQNKEGRTLALNLPPQPCCLTHFLPGDVLVANIRPYLKKVWMANVEGGCSKDVLVIRAKDNHYSEYIYALSLQDAFFENAMLGNKGTQMPRGDKKKIMEFPVFDYEKDDEHRIGKIIENIQNKISLNTRINAELEAMAKQLYDYWFVQFDFPDENGKPYKSSGGKMVYNKTLKREIPEGWQVIQIGEIAAIKSGFPFKSETMVDKGKYKIVTIKNVQDGYLDLSNFTCIDDLPNTIKEYCFLGIGDILISLTGNVGRVCIVSREDLLLNQRVGKIESKTGFVNWTYQLFVDKSIRIQIENWSNGCAQANVSPIDIENLFIIKPKDDLLVKYEKFVCDSSKNDIIMKQQNNYLTHLRDSLLPMLMNGQVTIE